MTEPAKTPAQLEYEAAILAWLAAPDAKVQQARVRLAEAWQRVNGQPIDPNPITFKDAS